MLGCGWLSCQSNCFNYKMFAIRGSNPVIGKIFTYCELLKRRKEKETGNGPLKNQKHLLFFAYSQAVHISRVKLTFRICCKLIFSPRRFSRPNFCKIFRSDATEKVLKTALDLKCPMSLHQKQPQPQKSLSQRTRCTGWGPSPTSFCLFYTLGTCKKWVKNVGISNTFKNLSL